MDSAAVQGSFRSLFDRIQKNFLKTSLSEDSWYILATACLVCHDPDNVAQLYLYLTQQPQFESPTARQALIRRIRETLVKSVSIVGVCKPIAAILAISAVERDADKDYSCSRDGWAVDDSNRRRGLDWFHKVYRQNSNSTLALFSGHKDFVWISENITYGLYLSDMRILGDIETELVVLSGIMSQNLGRETGWHIAGIRRVGVSKDDAQVVWDTIKMVATHFEADLNRVPAVSDVEPLV
jgi:hypothetical protein